MSKSLWSTLKPLEEEHARLQTQLRVVEARMEAALRAWHQGTNGTVPTKAPTAPKAKPPATENLKGQVRDLLTKNPTTEYDAAKVAKALGLGKDRTKPVRKAMQRLADDGDVKRVKEGVYQGRKR